MRTLVEQFDASQILQPFQSPEDARQDAVAWGPNLTIAKGTAVGQKTADQLMYAFVSGAGDGTQNAKGLAMYSFKTDANGMVFYVGSADTAAPTARVGPWTTSPIWINGTFHPDDLQTTTPVAQVDTFTPGGTITTGDVNKLTYTDSALQTRVASFTVGATTTAAAVSAGLIAAWNSDPVLAAVATASGTTTVVLTANKAGRGFTVASTVTGVGTLTRAATTANAGFNVANFIAAMPGAKQLHNGAIQF